MAGKPCSFDDYDWVDRYDEQVAADHKLYARYSDVLGAVAALGAPVPGMRILDIGTGTGELASRCAARGASVVGLDSSERMLSQARAKFPRSQSLRFMLVRDAFLEIPFPRAAFDAVVSTYAFHHVARSRKPAALTEMFRVLRPGGMWVLGDLAFEDEGTERKALADLPWLEEEDFPRIDELQSYFTQRGVSLNSEQFTPVTWVLWSSV